MKKKRWRESKDFICRVNIQVFFFACAIVVVAVFFVYILMFKVADLNLNKEITQRAAGVAAYVEQEIDQSVFEEVNSPEDQDTALYQKTNRWLLNVKEKMQVAHLFLIKKGDRDDFVYVMEASRPFDFVLGNSGQLVSRNFYEAAQLGWLDISSRQNQWLRVGKQHLSVYYEPVRDEKNNVIGLIGIAFDVSAYHKSHVWILAVTLGIVLCCFILSNKIAVKLFRRISNPLYHDYANTDRLTDLKNKNSFDTDIHNIENGQKQEKYSIVVIDLNGLKKVNDSQGHQVGDRYIQNSARILKASVKENHQVIYRIGGDEFVIIARSNSLRTLEELVLEIQANIEKENSCSSMKISMSIGYAVFDHGIDRNFSQTFQRADIMMYENKRKYYESHLLRY